MFIQYDGSNVEILDKVIQAEIACILLPLVAQISVPPKEGGEPVKIRVVKAEG